VQWDTMLQPQRDYMLQHRRTFNTTTSPWRRLPSGWVDKSIVCLAGLL
jgi:hypothetical protein